MNFKVKKNEGRSHGMLSSSLIVLKRSRSLLAFSSSSKSLVILDMGAPCTFGFFFFPAPAALRRTGLAVFGRRADEPPFLPLQTGGVAETTPLLKTICIKLFRQREDRYSYSCYLVEYAENLYHVEWTPLLKTKYIRKVGGPCINSTYEVIFFLL